MEVIYSNRVAVQSQLRSALLGGNPADDWAELHEFRKQQSLEALDSKNFRAVGRTSKQTETIRLTKTHDRDKEKNPKEYHALDERDPTGDSWIANDAVFLRDAHTEGLKEAMRVMLGDLAGGYQQRATELQQAPGYRLKVQELAELATAGRDVYQLKQGVLVSISKDTRMVPLGL